MYRASDVVTGEVVTVSLEMTVEQAIGILLKHRISGAPVVDRKGTVQGIVSEFQLLEVIYSPDKKAAPVTEFMTKDVLTVGPDSLLTDIASIMVLHKIHRVPVVRDGKPIGVISRGDLLRHVTQTAEAVSATVEDI